MSTSPSLGARLLSLVLALLMPLDTAPIIYFFLTRNLSAAEDRKANFQPGASKQGNSVARAFALAADPRSPERLSRQLTDTGGQVATLSMGYDPFGRVSAVTNPLGTFNVNYVDATQKVASVNYPNGQTTSYSYYPDVAASGTGNGDERLQQIQNLAPGGQTLSQFNYSYDPLGRITTWQRQLGSHPADKLTLSYDSGDQLVAAAKSDVATGNPLSVNAYAYDASGNRTGTELDAAGTSTVTSFTANNTNEISGGAAGGPMRVEGNLTQYATVTVNGQPATTDASNHFVGSATVQPGANTITVTATNPNSLSKSKSYTVTAAGGNNQTFSYDLNGNLTSDPGHTYQWDAANRLVTINYTGTANSTQFAYDGQGRRVGITETSNGTVTSQKSLFWEGAAISRETDLITGETRQFPGGGEIINGTPYFGTADHLGSTRELTDATGAVHAEYDYDPYGVAIKLAGDTDARFQYAGYYQHAASGNALTLFRAYNATAGRWLSRDPMGEAGGLNLYAYGLNNPIANVDPLGLSVNGALVGLTTAVVFMAAFSTGVGEVGLIGVGLMALVDEVAFLATAGALGSVASQLYDSGGNLACMDWGKVGQDAYLSVAGGVIASAFAPEIESILSAIGPALRKLGSLGRPAAENTATLGRAASTDYRATFFAANPELEGQVFVHHAVEQQVLTRYPGVVSEAEIHSLENLRGIPNAINSDVHLSQIRVEWNQFYRANPNPSQAQLLQKATEIDAKFGSQFQPPR